jgi:hypothetical protein
MNSSGASVTLEQLCLALSQVCAGLLNRADVEGITVVNDQGNVVYSSDETISEINQNIKNKLKQIKLASSVNLPDLQVVRINFGQGMLYCCVFASGWFIVSINSQTYSNLELIKIINEVVEDCYQMCKK